MTLPDTVFGMPWIKIINKDMVATRVDGELVIFDRSDRLSGHPMSGLASFGGVTGDHRAIAQIAEDITEAFNIIGETK